jgi:hypothetical protein
MELHHIHSPKTVAELKKLIADLPDDMKVSRLNRGELLPLDLSIQLRGKGNKHRTVSRGGVQFLAVTDF